ncbi:MAG: DUF6515 family protein [Pseudomonadota bacterium]
MTKTYLKTKQKIAIFLLALFLLSLAPSTESFADKGRKHHRGGPHYRHGQVIGKLPHGYKTLHVRNSPYYIFNGIFYRPAPSGYMVVSAPVGAIIASLPLGHSRISIGGAIYFTFGGNYYRQAPQGYVVVEAPPNVIVEPEPQVYSSVQVVVNRLNVRSGPGQGHPVVFQLQGGTMLTVFGSAPGWYYVQLPNGQFGWVMDRFTRMTGPPPADG